MARPRPWLRRPPLRADRSPDHDGSSHSPRAVRPSRRIASCPSRKGGDRYPQADHLRRDGVRDVHGDPGHPDRVGLAERDPGRAVGEFGGGGLGSDELPHRRGHHDPALRDPVTRLFDPLSLRVQLRRLHADELHVFDRDRHQPDDRLPGPAGLHRRRHDPHGVCRRLHHLPARQAADRGTVDRPRGDARPDDRTDGRRLSHRHLLLALAVPGQRRAGHRRVADGLVPDRLRQARLLSSRAVRLVRPARHGLFPRRHGICAGGRPSV